MSTITAQQCFNFTDVHIRSKKTISSITPNDVATAIDNVTTFAGQETGGGGTGSGTVNSSTANKLAFYSADGNAVDGLSSITPDKVLISSVDGLPVASSTDTTKLSYLDATSPIQEQINSKQATLVSGTNIKTINGTSVLGSGNIVISGGGGSGTVNGGTANRLTYYPATANAVSNLPAIDPNKVLISDANGLPEASTVSPTTLGYLDVSSSVTGLLNGKQATLVSATNIKTINGNSILGSGDLSISGGGGSGTVNSGVANRLTYYSASGTAVTNLAAITANKALVSDANGLPIASTVADTDLLLFKRNHTSQALADGATITMDCSIGHIGIVTLAGNRNIVFTNVPVWYPIRLLVTQDSTGSRTLTFPATTYIPNGWGTGVVPNLSTVGSAMDLLEVLYTGSIYIVVFVKNLTH